MARNRPGKRERLNAKRDSFQAQRAAIMAANALEGKPDAPVKPSREALAVLRMAGASTKYVAPKGIRASIVARDTLKGASHDIGFVGPRGFKTPKDMVSREEKRGGLLAPSVRLEAERKRALELAATVRVQRPTQKD